MSRQLLITANAPSKSSNWSGGLYPKGAPIEKRYFAIRQACQSSRLDWHQHSTRLALFVLPVIVKYDLGCGFDDSGVQLAGMGVDLVVCC
jgi:hypothetical protein